MSGFRPIFAVILFAAFGATGALGSLWILNADKIAYGVNVVDLAVGGLTLPEAENALSAYAENYRYDARIPIEIAGRRIFAAPAELGILLFPEEAALASFSFGRQNSFIFNLVDQAAAFLFGHRISMRAELDEAQFKEFEKESLRQAYEQPRNATFVYSFNKDAFEPISAKEGLIADIEALKQTLLQNAEKLSTDSIFVQTKKTFPDVLDNETAEALMEAELIVSRHPYVLAMNGEIAWNIEKKDLISWLEFIPLKKNGEIILGVELSESATRQYIGQFAPEIDQPAVDAEFALEGGRVTSFRPSRPGKIVAIAETASKIADGIKKGELVIPIVTRTVEPAINTEETNNFGIRELLGRGKSDFAGSSQSRAHNIRVGSEKFQGLLIAPGEEFSFNRYLGEVTKETGYLPELTIRWRATVFDYGGGLCQVSTTLFRAAVLAGLQITDRTSHSYPVVYYSPQGFDAAIFPPEPDLKFRNNTPSYILLQYKIAGTKLVWEIYGTNDGRTTVIDGPYEYDKKNDGSLRAWLRQTVYKGDAEIESRVFYSNYNSPRLYPIARNPYE